jgi:hypothetical protein
MIFFFLAIFSTVFLYTIEIGVLAFVTTIILIVIALIIKINKNKQLEKTKS